MLDNIVKRRTYVMRATKERGRIPQEIAKGGALVGVACLQKGGIIEIKDGAGNETRWGGVVPIGASLVDRSIKMGRAQYVIVIPIPHPNLRGASSGKQVVRKRWGEPLDRWEITGECSV